MDILGEHAFPQLIRVFLVALGNRSADLLVRKLQDILEPYPVRVLFGDDIGLIHKDSRIRNRPELSLLCHPRTNVISPMESGQSTCRLASKDQMGNGTAEYLIALMDRLQLSTSDILSPEVKLRSLVKDGLRTSALMARSVAILEENSRPVVEVVVRVIRKNALSESLGGLVSSGGTKVCLAALVAIFSGGGEVVIPTPSTTLDEDENFLGVALPDVIGSLRPIQALSIHIIQHHLVIDQRPAGHRHHHSQEYYPNHHDINLSYLSQSK